MVCVDATGFDDIQERRIYRTLVDVSGAASSFVRVVDDSGEDYLYPATCFLPVDLPRDVEEALGVATPL